MNPQKSSNDTSSALNPEPHPQYVKAVPASEVKIQTVQSLDQFKLQYLQSGNFQSGYLQNNKIYYKVEQKAEESKK